MIKIIIIDDHQLVRSGLVRLVESDKDFKVTGEGGDGRTALELCKKLKPDIALLDFSLPDMDGFELITQIAKAAPSVGMIIVTMHDNEEYAARALESGAKGYIIKGAAAGELLAAIKKVADGGVYITHAVMERMVSKKFTSTDNDNISDLSIREFQIFTKLAKGIRINEISGELCISASTINTYKKRIFEKLNIKTNSDLVRLAIKHKVIDEN